jgi:transcriptional regulator with XRE-family HTH domain
MHTRLQDIIQYKTGGRQTEFADLMGWSPQYLAKLVRGETFGIRPVVAIIEKFPDIDARWFVTGKGEMVSETMYADIRKSLHAAAMGAHRMIEGLIELERFIPVMSPKEIRELEQTIAGQRKANFSPETIKKWEELLRLREDGLGAKFAAAYTKSDELCSQRKAKK